MATPDEQIQRFRAAYAAARTPLITTHMHKGERLYFLQKQPGGPQESLLEKQFLDLIALYEQKAPHFDNGVTLDSVGGVDDPPPPPDP